MVKLSKFMGVRTLAVLLICSLVTACSTTSTGNSTTPQSSSAKNIIRITMDSDIDNLDPYAFKSDAAQMVVDATYETFVDFGTTTDSDGTIIANSEEMVPGLTNVTLSPDGKVVTFKINSGATFTNGDPVDAEAVAFSINRALTSGGYAALLWNIITVNNPDQVKVIDNSTVELTLAKGNPMTTKVLPLALNVAMNPKVTQEHATDADKMASNWYKHNILGTGPYVLSNWTPGVEYTLSPAENYWNKGKVKNDGVLVKVVPDAQQRLALLKQGAVDVALGLPPKNLSQLKEDPNITVHDFPSRNTNYLVMNNTIKPFDNPLVRQAITLAIPYKDLINNVLYGFGRPLTSPVPEGMPTHLDTMSENPTNIEKAKELMKQAGVSGFDTQLYVNSTRTEDQQVAVLIKSALEQIGINVTINKVSDATYRENQQKGIMPMFIEYWYSWVNDPFFQLYWMFDSKNTFTNMARYSNPEVDELISQGMYEQDAAKREAISRKIQEIILKDAPIALLYQRNYVVAANKDIKGMNLWPDQHLRFHTLHK